MPANRSWISLAEASRRLSVSPTVVYRLVRHEQLTVRRLPGCHPRVNSAELDRLVEASTHRPSAA